MRKAASYNSGFTLIEVLVALLLLGLGALAVINMQARALQNAQVAYTRSIAALVAMDAAEQLWADHANNAAACGVKDQLEGSNGIIKAVEERWNDASPLHGYSLVIEHVDNSECRFEITITSNKVPDEDGELIFSLTLPLPEDLYDEPVP